MHTLKNEDETETKTETTTATETKPSTDVDVVANLLVDFNIGDDMCLSEFLNSDFSTTCSFDYNDLLSSPCSDQTQIFSDEILKNWAQCNFGDETNVSNNLHSFNSFLESSEEVLGE
ncbi:unnamed protein product [Lathyrus sativus]|nr:unnamed protein product [Lathyrus sativus]